MRHIWHCLLILVFLCGIPAPVSGDAPQEETPPPALRMGIVPFYSAPTLLRVHRPLRDHLSRALKREVLIYTSHNHERFLNDIFEGRFDIVVSPAHFLPILADRGYAPLVRYSNPFELLLVVRKGGNIDDIDDLRGRRIGLPDRLSFYYIVGMQWFHSMDQRLGHYSLIEQSSHVSGLLAVAAGRIDASVTGRPAWKFLNREVRERLDLVEIGHPEMPSLTTLASGELGAEELERIRAALNAFPQTESGQQFFAASGYGGYIPATTADVEDARRYEKLVFQLMSAQARAAARNTSRGIERTQ
jgi:phosphonate transport system substrate-binding protein